MEFVIAQTVNLHADNLPLQYDAGLEYGDSHAHTWRVRVMNGGAPADLSGCTCRLYYTRTQPRMQEGDPGIATVIVNGRVSGCYAEATFVPACYSQVGPAVAVLRILQGQRTVAVARLHTWVRRDVSDSIVDPDKIIPSLEELLACIDEMQRATAAANKGAQRAENAADDADRATRDAQDATETAREVTERWDDVSLSYEVLPPSEDPRAELEQDEHSTKFKFFLPTSNLAYSTFEVNDTMELIMTSPDGFSDIGFALTQDGDLEVVIN